MPIAEANGQRLYYEAHGEGEPLLCVMGLGADHLAWTLQVPAWSASHRLVVFDNRDVGQSSYADAPYEVRDMAADALGLADALELESFHLVGLSLGGAIAQEMALAAPERVRTLSLVVTYPGLSEWGRQRARVFRTIVERMTREEQVEFLMLLVHSDRLFANEHFVTVVRDAILGNPHAQSTEAFVRQLEAGARHDARPRLPELSMPVQVIGADRDVMVPPHNSLELAELIPGATLSRIDAGHAVNIEAAEELNAAVLDFVAEHAAAPA